MVEHKKVKLLENKQTLMDTDCIQRGYKNGIEIEKGVVNGYTKSEDKFIDAYLTKDGETVEEAKERLKKENK